MTMERAELRSETKYRKIYTLFDRDGKFKIISGVINPEIHGIENVKNFIATEKIDGTNCGIILTPEKEIFIRKRSDIIVDDNEHHHYFEATKDIDMEKIKDYFSESKSLTIIFGEACGGNIQKQGKTYSDKPTFKLIDIKCGNSFFDWDDVVKFSKFTGIPTVEWFTLDSKHILEHDYWLTLLRDANKKRYVEGYVVRSRPALLNKFGVRMMFKIKLEDFKPEEKIRNKRPKCAVCDLYEDLHNQMKSHAFEPKKEHGK